MPTYCVIACLFVGSLLACAGNQVPDAGPVDTGSAPDTVAAILDVSSKDLDPSDLERIAGLIDQARKEGK